MDKSGKCYANHGTHAVAVVLIVVVHVLIARVEVQVVRVVIIVRRT